MTKKFRQDQILQLIRKQSLHTQEELARALKELGIETTQVTLSRDLRELGLIKTPDGYRQLTESARAVQSHFTALAGEFLRDVRRAQNQVVLRTAPGHASSIAVAMDQEQWPDVVGTIAGDDTILVICHDPATADAVSSRLLSLVG
jgi:transcriptional regulator of arginine metabolism